LPAGAVEASVARELEAARGAVEALARRADADPAALASACGELGMLYAAYDLFDSARACFAHAQTLAPADFRWAYYLGFAEEQKGNPGAAEANLEAALALDPKSVPAWVRLGTARLLLGRTAEARRAFERALALDPGCAAAHYGLGKVQAGDGDHGGAASRFERALALAPQASALHVPLAQAYRRLGRLDEARRHLALRGEAAVPLADPWVEAVVSRAGAAAFHKFRGDEAVVAGRLEEAGGAYRRAVVADPDRFAYRKSLGSTLYHLGRVAEAEAEFHAALGTEPEGPPERRARERAEIHFALGGIAANRGDDPGALRHFQEAVRLDPAHLEASFQLGNLYGRAGRLAEALEAFSRVLASEPAHRGARLQRATTLMDLGRFAEAIADLERKLELDPDDARARWLLGVARQRAGKS
jgi:tetratricopeptide (TPR) repeat protein